MGPSPQSQAPPPGTRPRLPPQAPPLLDPLPPTSGSASTSGHTPVCSPAPWLHPTLTGTWAGREDTGAGGCGWGRGRRAGDRAPRGSSRTRPPALGRRAGLAWAEVPGPISPSLKPTPLWAHLSRPQSCCPQTHLLPQPLAPHAGFKPPAPPGPSPRASGPVPPWDHRPWVQASSPLPAHSCRAAYCSRSGSPG